jgi:hypothetical protein
MEDKHPDLRLVTPETPRRTPKRKLTVKQERFVAAVIKGATASEAYRTAYNVESMRPANIWTESSRLMAHPMVAPRIRAGMAHIERGAVSSALSRRRWIVERLEIEAKTAESDAARVRALELLGKTQDVRLFADIVETTNTDSSPDEVRRELEVRLTKLLAG